MHCIVNKETNEIPLASYIGLVKNLKICTLIKQYYLVHLFTYNNIIRLKAPLPW